VAPWVVPKPPAARSKAANRALLTWSGVSEQPHSRQFRLVVLVLVLAVVLAGCGVTTTVGVRVGANGTGDVTVQVVIDRQTVSEVGGLAGQLRTSDLVEAGWVVKGPRAGRDGAEVVTVTHRFAQLDQVPAILAEVASSGSVSKAPFVLHLVRSGPSTRVTTTAVGRVNLRCGLSCFGDAGLQKAFGSDVGVNASAFSGKSGAAAARRDFVFYFTLSVPGRVVSTDASSRRGATLKWRSVLGAITKMHASSVVVIPVASQARAKGKAHAAAVAPTDGAHSAGASLIVVVVVAILALASAWRLLRRRRRRGRLETT
jgi:hypothetical protein